MSTIYAYEREPYRTELATEILATGEEDARPFAVLADTILHPASGGQPTDRGRLAAVGVVAVEVAGDDLRHYLDAPAAVGPATLTLDWPHRYDLMQQHTAQHLLSAVAADRWGWETTSFHLGDPFCDVELAVKTLSAADLEALEEAVVAEIRADHAVTARRVPPAELHRLGVRSRGLPAGYRGDVRLVEIAGIDCNTCGGTHLRSTREIETLKLLTTEPMRGGVRLHWIAGRRVRRRLGEHEARNARLRAVLDAGDDELVAIAEHKLAQLKQAGRRRKALAGRWAEAVAEGLMRRHEPILDAHFDDADAGFLQQVARQFGAADHRGAILLTAAGDQGTFFVVAAGRACGLDVQEAGRRVATALGGRGGGSGRIFQGKAHSLDRRAEAVAVLASSAG